MINKKSGNVIFDRFIIYRGMKKTDFLSQVQAEDIFSISNSIKTGSTEFQNIMLNIQSAQNRFFSIRIYFKNSVVDYLVFSMRNNRELPKWENWNLEEEKRLHAEHSLWLKKELGHPPYTYSWGKVWSEIDAHTQTSCLGLKYSETTLVRNQDEKKRKTNKDQER